MQVFGVKAEPIKRPKKCCNCKKQIESGQNMYFGHSVLFSMKDKFTDTGDELHWTCENCVNNKQGYITTCYCMESL